MSTNAPTRTSVAIAVLAASSAAAGLVHAAAAGTHSGQRTLSVLFAALAAAQVAGAAVVALGWGGRRGIAGALAVNLLALAAWATTRRVGFDFIEGLEQPQSVGFPDAVAAGLAAVAVLAGFAALRRAAMPATVRPAFAVAAGAVALIAAIPAMAAPHGHDAGNAVEVTAAADHGAEPHGHGGAGGSLAPVRSAEEQLLLDVSLPEVAGITQEQKVKAATLIKETKAAMAAYPDVASAEAAGFVSIGDGRTGFEHFVNRGFLADAVVLDPTRVESLVFKVNADGTKSLASAMYILPPGKTMADVPDIAGSLTQWHDHQNLCWDPTGTRVAGILVDGKCTPGGTFRATPPMLHVWVTEHPCGPFAGIEGSAHTGACHTDDHTH